ncbi:hypothetical protein [Jannaschia pohangensis]|uniref:Uncharacterized protein n=1 Tax=Jannaschia pohangensis TaxID=390807 RepID=A0A1I3TZP6_9RHOB|nr:hypothetical protein [Jannaschia pohangensis]SFJ75769.1 hypothetical protein SAMN04488095_3587 [Jannaschia pohangensis]
MAVLPFFNATAIWRSGQFPKPWSGERVSIHDRLFALREAGTNLNDLEVEEEGDDPRKIRFAAGMLDNVLGGSTDGAREVDAALRRVLAHPTKGRIKDFVDLLNTHRTIGLVDDVTERVMADPPDLQKLGRFAQWLAKDCPMAEPAKFGLAMIGLIEGSDTGVLRLFAGHEEFSKFAVIALGRLLPEAEARPLLEAAARDLNGWGRIDLVERLAAGGDADWRRWLVREGYQNAIMYEYLACLAAREGDLAGQLRDMAGADTALLDGAGDILRALSCGGPAEEMVDYAEGASASVLWLEAIGRAPLSLRHGACAIGLRRGVEGYGWTAEDGARVTGLVAAYLAREGLADLVRAALTGADEGANWDARQVGPEVGVDVWQIVFDRQMAEPERSDWFALMTTKDAERVAKVVDLALVQLPLEDLETGPADEMGFGPDWKDHSALDYIVQELRHFPGLGWPLIAVALRSPVTRNRNMACKALAAWERGTWPEAALPLLRQARAEEPNANTADQMEALFRPAVP